MREDDTPEIGMGVTARYATDREAFTVVEILGPRKIVIQRDKATLTSGDIRKNAQVYDIQPDPDGEKRTLSLRKTGQWLQVGDATSDPSVTYVIGYRREYYDPEF